MANPYAPKKKKIVVVEEVQEEIPEGNIKELKDWVGDDVDKAKLLLEEENSHESPRKTLVTALEEIING